MTDPYIVGTIDITELVFLAFVLFFIGLVFYLRREDRREGYPLEDEATGRVESRGGALSRASPKTFNLPHGHGIATPEAGARDRFDIPAKRAFGSNGAAYVPTGDPLLDGIGPPLGPTARMCPTSPPTACRGSFRSASKPISRSPRAIPTLSG